LTDIYPGNFDFYPHKNPKLSHNLAKIPIISGNPKGLHTLVCDTLGLHRSETAVVRRRPQRRKNARVNNLER
jgi:hypothetical protein